jgi:S-adenosylmethionine/arginine decarboxylase-like enzyme
MSAAHRNFGAELILDLHGCDPKLIRSKAKLATFARQLCRRIKMERYGEPILAHFGHKDPMTSGYSLVQLIETSSIVGHFSEGTNKVYLNVFSCKEFDPADAAAFCRKFFKAKGNHRRYIIRK